MLVAIGFDSSAGGDWETTLAQNFLEAADDGAASFSLQRAGRSVGAKSIEKCDSKSAIMVNMAKTAVTEEAVTARIQQVLRKQDRDLRVATPERQK